MSKGFRILLLAVVVLGTIFFLLGRAKAEEQQTFTPTGMKVESTTNMQQIIACTSQQGRYCADPVGQLVENTWPVKATDPQVNFPAFILNRDCPIGNAEDDDLTCLGELHLALANFKVDTKGTQSEYHTQKGNFLKFIGKVNKYLAALEKDQTSDVDAKAEATELADTIAAMNLRFSLWADNFSTPIAN